MSPTAYTGLDKREKRKLWIAPLYDERELPTQTIA